MPTPHDTRRPWNVVEFPVAAIRHRAVPVEPSRHLRWRWPAVLWGVIVTAAVLALAFVGTAWWTMHSSQRTSNVWRMCSRSPRRRGPYAPPAPATVSTC